MIKKERLKRINREWLEENGFSPLEEVRKRIEGDNYPIKRKKQLLEHRGIIPDTRFDTSALLSF